MARLGGTVYKPAVKLPPTQTKKYKNQKEPTPELSDSDIESFDEDFDEDIEFEDVDSDDLEEMQEVSKNKKVSQKKTKEESDADEEDEDEEMENIEGDETDEDEQEYEADPKSFVLAVDDEEDDSDREVEIALKAGLVKASNIPQKHPNVSSKYMVNNVAAMKERLQQLKSKQPWINTIDVSASPELVFDKRVDDDFEREAMFHKQAEDSVGKAVEKLKELKIPVIRPDDYFAEMAKSDRQMQRIRKILIDKQKETERREMVRRIRNEKKFSVKVQKEVEQRKIAEKRKFTDAVKKAKKGMKGQLEQMLNNASKLQEYDDEAETQPARKRPKMSRTARNKKFGSGLFKTSKRNDKQSFENVDVTGKKARFSKKAFVGKKRR
uniref:rRNA processing protein EBP2 n=1 Tax=Panagrolaimus sp. JU765 TaxID=591449 RepID=A0AC34QCF5_9BILA